MSDFLKNLTEEQRCELVQLVDTWLVTRNGANPPDAVHSALLWRLLTGKKPLENKPPKYMSRPWYTLYDNGFDKIFEAPWVSDHGDGDKFNVVIGQHRGWAWVDKENNILEHKNGSRCKFNPSEMTLTLIK